jgi:ATP-dependent Lon protease
VGAIEEAAASPQKLVAVFAQQTDESGNYSGDLYTIGCGTAVARMAKLPNGAVQVLLQGTVRVRLLAIEQQEPWLRVRIEPIADIVEPTSTELNALWRTAQSLFARLVEISDLPNELLVGAAGISAPGPWADFVAANINIRPEERQSVLAAINVSERLRLVAGYLNREMEIAQVQADIRTQVQGEVDRRQREFYLREQLRAIQRELGESDTAMTDLADLRRRVDEAHMSEEARKEADRELDRLATIPPASPEYQVARTYLEWLVSLPWDVTTPDNLDLDHAEQVLNEDHYDLEKIKRRILDFLAVRKLNPTGRSPILCFVGPPGVGKTSLGRSIARALGRKFVRLSLGGVRDEAEIRGHRRTYIGALPGRIIQELRRAGTRNPLFMLDEIDKLGTDFRGDPASAMLEVLDPEQNNTFVDHYLDVPFDLSQVMFITTANVLDTIPAPLRDRMEIIELSGYTEQDKLWIAKRYLVPRQMQENGIPEGLLTITDEALMAIIQGYTREAGVRNLERQIATVCRGVARKLARGEDAAVTVTPETLSEYLGPPRFRAELAGAKDEIGVATGLAFTPAGGEILFVEAMAVPGKGGLTLTGQLGDVMRESAQAAVTYARRHAQELGIPRDFFERHDIHIHVPAGAIPKDGPSAGVTMATALVSAASNRPVRKDVAMTGEITLRGKVLPIGGLKEKALAAHRAGIHTIIIPRDNERDLEDIPAEVRKDLTIILADTVDDVLNAALHPEPVKEAAVA